MDIKLVIERQRVRGHVVREVEWGPKAAREGLWESGEMG